MDESDNKSCLIEKINRKQIDILRRRLNGIKCKTPDNQEILLIKDEKSKIATICIKSGAKNALSGKMISQLTEIIDELYNWNEAKGLLIRGYGNTFCSGSDLISVKETANPEQGLQLAQIMQYNMLRIQQLPLVSVAFIEGYALGGGAELSTCADFRLMTDSAKIGFVHVKVGVCCGWGGGTRLVQLVGPSRALDLLSSGRLIGAEEAIQFGLVNGKVKNEMEAYEFLGSHAIGTNDTIKALKCMLNSTRILPTLKSLEMEGKLFASTWGSVTHLEALERNMKHK